MAGSAPKLPLQKNLSRRVSFNEASLRRRHEPDTESQSDKSRHCGAICSTCCFWVSLILGLSLFVLIILSSMYYAFLKSNLPDVRLQRLDVFKIDVDSTRSDTLLTADFVVSLNATNGNGKAQLVYHSMKATMSSAGIEFGHFKMEDVTEAPLSSTILTVPASIKNLTVEDAAANELYESGKIRMLVIDVHVRGKIDVYVGGKKMSGFPFKIECWSIDQTEIDVGHAPKCSAQLATPLRLLPLLSSIFFH
ncbi:hypothetical protein ACS0TY_014930 [Phlomoides rotata]